MATAIPVRKFRRPLGVALAAAVTATAFVVFLWATASPSYAGAPGAPANAPGASVHSQQIDDYTVTCNVPEDPKAYLQFQRKDVTPEDLTTVGPRTPGVSEGFEVSATVTNNTGDAINVYVKMTSVMHKNRGRVPTYEGKEQEDYRLPGPNEFREIPAKSSLEFTGGPLYLSAYPGEGWSLACEAIEDDREGIDRFDTSLDTDEKTFTIAENTDTITSAFRALNYDFESCDMSRKANGSYEFSFDVDQSRRGGGVDDFDELFSRVYLYKDGEEIYHTRGKLTLRGNQYTGTRTIPAEEIEADGLYTYDCIVFFHNPKNTIGKKVSLVHACGDFPQYLDVLCLAFLLAADEVNEDGDEATGGLGGILETTFFHYPIIFKSGHICVGDHPDCGTEEESPSCFDNLGTLTEEVSQTGQWTSGCESVARSGSRAKFYNFTVNQREEVTISLESNDADTYLYLRGAERTGRVTTGPLIAENDDHEDSLSKSEIQMTLDPGIYIAEATTYNQGKNGSFTMSVSRTGESTTPTIGDCVESLSTLRSEVTRAGEWTSGCASNERSGSYSRFYEFNLSSSFGPEVVITLESDDADTYLYLWEGNGESALSAQSGSFLYENNDHEDDTSVSRIQESIDSLHFYTIEATTHDPGETGSFRLTITPGDSTTPTTGECVEDLGTLTGQVTRSGEWTGDCESIEQEDTYARFYSFTLEEETEVTIDLESEVDTYLYLREGDAQSGESLNDHDDDDDAGDDRNSQAVETLEAGSYTIEATTFDEEETGSFTLTITPSGATTTPTVGGCVESLLESLQMGTGEVTRSGEWTSGCESNERPGSYSRFYEFNLSFHALGQTPETEVIITLESDDADTYLYLWDGNGESALSSQSGSFLHENNDHEGDASVSRIQENIDRLHFYTIEATTLNPGETGSFTLTVVDGFHLPSTEECLEDLGTLTAQVTRDGEWRSDCASTEREDTYARFYSFTLDEEREVTIDLESEKDTYLYLREGDAQSGESLNDHDDDDDAGDDKNSQAVETLGAGSYTIEATTFDEEETGSFTLAITPSGATTTPTVDCVETIAVSGSVDGRWSAGCESVARDGRYARFYTLTLDQQSDITINLESDDADTYLYLREDGAQSGNHLYENDDHEGDTSISLIQETLSAGTYTIEATTFDEEETGSFTLTISGPGGTTPSTDGCLQAVAVGETITGQWASGCESEAESGSYARFYTLTLDQGGEVTITLESDDADTYLYLREDDVQSGSHLYENDDHEGDTSISQIQETLEAGTYTIEATTFWEGKTGSFTLTFSGRGGTMPRVDDCEQYVSVDRTLSDQWSTACESEARSGSYAKFYILTLAEQSEVTITLESSDADPYLYLRSRIATSGPYLKDNDDHEGDTSISQIQETLEAGTYTIEATTYGEGETGGFTLGISGSGGITATIDSCLEAVTVNATVGGVWASDCESDERSGSYARFYTFPLDQKGEVTITLRALDVDTYLYLRAGNSTSGPILYSNDDYLFDRSASLVREVLDVDTYTIEATTYEAGETGRFVITISGPGGDETDSKGCVGPIATGGSVSGQWASGCDSEARTGSYARFYTFSLEEGGEVAITLESDDADTYLYLRSGNTTSGPFAYENDDYEASFAKSKIQETLDADTYTIEATTYGENETGNFTLAVSDPVISAPPPLRHSRGGGGGGTTSTVTSDTPARAFASDPLKDFSFPPSNDGPGGIWSDGTTMWVADSNDGKIFAYNLSSKQRDASKDFDTLSAAGNIDPNGIWSDGTIMWVADSNDGKIFAYNLSSKQRDASKDFDTLSAAGNIDPNGIWSDGTTMWVADGFDNKIYAYSVADKQRDAAKDFDTLSAAGNIDPDGIWSDDTTMWVADYNDGKIYAYDMATKQRDASKDFDTLSAAGNIDPENIWSDGTTMWVVDNSSIKIYAYSLATKQRDSGEDFDTLITAGNTSPQGIWSEGKSMWVADDFDNKIYAYSLATKQRDAGEDFDTLITAGNTSPQGIWSEGKSMWVADDFDNKIYAYSLATKQREAGGDFDTLITAGNTSPEGIWSDGVTMWVADSSDGKIYAYSLTTKQRDSAKDFNTLAAAGNVRPTGIWSDGTTMWVVDHQDNKIYAYNLANKDRDEGKDFNTLIASVNLAFESIWSDGTTMWVADNLRDNLFAYHMPPKDWNTEQDFNFPATNDLPAGLWSNGATMWVADQEDDKIYAYGLSTKVRDSDEDFDTLDHAENNSPGGIWSDATTMWVADQEDSKIYAYNLNTKQRDSAKDFNTLTSSGNDQPTGIWSDGTTMWVVDDPDNKIYAYNLDTKQRDSAKDFNTLTSSGNDSPVGIWSDDTTVWVTDREDNKNLCLQYREQRAGEH